MQSYSQEVGDGIVQKLDVNFKAKRTTLLLERWGDAEEAERITVVFVGVELQDFKDFSDFNILHDINEAESPAQFWDEYREWLEARRNYLSVGVLENIAADTTLRYFSALLLASDGRRLRWLYYLQRPYTALQKGAD